MRTLYVFLAVILATVMSANAQANDKPLRQPAFLGGIDSASKNFIRMENANRHKSKAYEDQDRLQGTLIEDPRVIFSTYLGGNGYDCGNSLSVTQDSGVYVVGYTGSTNFPVSEDAVQKEKKGGHDMFVGKFTKTGERVWLTYLGGNGTDVATECVTDKDDNLILVGKTNSADFPTTEGVEQKEFQGSVDVVIVKFDPTGKIIWSRFYGGTNGEVGEGIALCANKYDFVITGSTLSKRDESGNRPLPVTTGCYQDSLAQGKSFWQTPLPDAFVSKFTGDGKLVWGTYFGGKQNDAAHAVAVDKDDNIAIVGETKTQLPPEPPAFPVTPDAFMKDTCSMEDAFFAKFSSTGNLIYSTLYCGKGTKPSDDQYRPRDWANDVKFDYDGNAIFCGQTRSILFPTTPDSYKPVYEKPDVMGDEGYIVKFNKFNQRIWATYFGGDDGDEIYSIASFENNGFWISGYTMSYNFLLSKDAIFNYTFGQAKACNFITKFDNHGFPSWSSAYYAGFCYKISILNDSNIFFTGEQMWSIDFPITNGAFQNNADPEGEYDSYLVHIKLPSKSGTIDPMDSNKADSIAFYPNPVNDNLYIKLPESLQVDITVYDVFGKKIKSQSFTKQIGKLKIDVSNIFSGCYSLSIQYDNKIENIMFLKL